jgi:hypothetical protein
MHCLAAASPQELPADLEFAAYTLSRTDMPPISPDAIKCELSNVHLGLARSEPTKRVRQGEVMAGPGVPASAKRHSE